MDLGSGAGVARGHLHVGPALVGAAVNESDVLRYELFWSDACEERMGFALGSAPAGLGDACCRSDVYAIEVNARPPVGATGWVVYAVLATGRAPVGVFVALNETTVVWGSAAQAFAT